MGVSAYLCTVNIVKPIKILTTMKKIFTLLMMALVAMTTFTSRDRDTLDREEARTLDGTWTGYIETYYRDRWNKSGDTYRTTFYFSRSNPYGGRGYEIDYNIYNRYVDYYCEFTWEVSNGRIHIKYDDSSVPVIIYEYRLDNNFFDGYMDDGTNRDIYFRLTYDGSFDWNSWRSTWRRSQAAKAPAATNSAAADSTATE